MSLSTGKVREIAWSELFPSLILLRVFRIAISVRILLLATVAILLLSAGWKLIGLPFSGIENKELQQTIAFQGAWPWHNWQIQNEFSSPLSEESQQAVDQIPAGKEWIGSGPMFRVWKRMVAPFAGLYLDRNSPAKLLYLCLCCLWESLIWALFAGAITRMAALSLTRNENAGLKDAFQHVRKRVLSYWMAPLIPSISVLVIVLLLTVPSLLLRFDIGLFVGSILWPVLFLIGLVFAFVLLGLLFGWPLMAPTISTEGTDAFDALSRSYAYVYQRPLHFFFYVVVASGLGILGVLVVDQFVGGVMYLGNLPVSWALDQQRVEELNLLLKGQEPEQLSWSFSTGASIIALWVKLTVSVAIGFRYAFFWVAATAIYLLLRRHTDATEMDEVFLEDQQESYGLPPLSRDAEGVPGVADVPQAEKAGAEQTSKSPAAESAESSSDEDDSANES